MECVDSPEVICWYILTVLATVGCEKELYEKYWKRMVDLVEQHQSSSSSSDVSDYPIKNHLLAISASFVRLLIAITTSFLSLSPFILIHIIIVINININNFAIIEIPSSNRKIHAT